MDNFKKEVRGSLLSLGAIVVVFVGFMLVAKGQIADFSTRITEAQSLMSQQRTVSSQLIELREDEGLAAKYGVVINVLIPTDNQIFDLERWLVASAQTYNTGIVFAYSGSKLDPTEGTLGNFPFSMKLSGKASDIAEFLDFLENKSSQFLMSFDNMSIGAVQGESSLVALNGKAYFRTEENE